MSRLLLDEQPLVIQPGLAKAIGLNEAIVVQQLHYWLEINHKSNKNYFDGNYWTYNSINEWQEKVFFFWSYDTVKRAFRSLEKKEILLIGNYNKDRRDRTKWYSIDYERLDEFLAQCNGADCTNTKGQNAPTSEGNLPQPLPENTENTTEITNNTADDEESNGQEEEKNISSNSNEFQNIISVFNQNIHPVTPLEAEGLSDWLKDLEADVIIMAIKEAVTNNARNMKYINRILNTWLDKGLKTKEAVLSYIRDWEDKKKKRQEEKEKQQQNSNNTYYQKPSKFVNFQQREWDFDELERKERELLRKELENKKD